MRGPTAGPSGSVRALLFLVIFPIALFHAAEARAGVLETMIDLNYTYEQVHVGPIIIEASKMQQKYEIRYEAPLTPIFDLLASVRLDIEDTSGDFRADTNKVAPTLELAAVGDRALGRYTYDAAINKTDEYRDTAGVEAYANSHLFELEVAPDYWPEAKLKYEQKRGFQEQSREEEEKKLELYLRKDIGDLYLEFDFDKISRETTLPARRTADEIEWGGKAAYQSTVWWDVDVDLTYEIREVYGEDFTKGVFTDEEEEYVQEIQTRLMKSLQFMPNLRVDLTYDYQFKQDLLRVDFDYDLVQSLTLDADWVLATWLDVAATVQREVEENADLPPEEKVETLQDTIELSFDARPVDWLQVTGRGEWKLDEEIKTGTGGSLDETDEETYEIAVRHTWGNWWDLAVTGTNGYKHTDNWLTMVESQLKADLQLTFFDDLKIDTTYEIERVEEWMEREPLDYEATRDEEFGIKFDYSKDFTSLIQTNFSHEFGLRWENTLDEVLNFEEDVELTEDTKIKVALVDFIRRMRLEGEVTRKASDTKDDEEPLLVDITYTLRWEWEVRDLTLEATYKYDDNGDTFDESTFNSKVGWQRDNFDVTGEYQFDKVHTEDDELIVEARKVNLKMNIKF